MNNILFAHGGAPTAVLNASLAGAIEQLRKRNFGGKILAARFGSRGIINNDLIDLTAITQAQIELLKQTSGSAIGTSRMPLYEKEYCKIVDNIKRNNIGYVLFAGGNGSMDTIGNIHQYAARSGCSVICGGIPKTIDNDIAVTDHAPGYASAARYMAATVRNCFEDVRSLPIHISIIESMGRNTGWLAAASSLATENCDVPQLIYMPEIPFCEDNFLSDIEKQWAQRNGLVVVVSEGLRYADGKPIVKPVLQTERAVYFGDIASHLATLVMEKLGIKARSEKPGLIGRCSSALASDIDRLEACLMGATATDSVLDGTNGMMAGIKRLSNQPYAIQPMLIPIKQVMMVENTFPQKYMNATKNGVNKQFAQWLSPLVGALPSTISFVDKEGI